MNPNLVFCWILAIMGIITTIISISNLNVIGIEIMLYFSAILNYLDYLHTIRNED